MSFQQENMRGATTTNGHDPDQSSNGDRDETTIPDQNRQQEQLPSQEDVCGVESASIDFADSDGDIGTSVLDSNADLQTQQEDGPFHNEDANLLQHIEHEHWWHAVKNEPDLCV